MRPWPLSRLTRNDDERRDELDRLGLTDATATSVLHLATHNGAVPLNRTALVDAPAADNRLAEGVMDSIATDKRAVTLSACPLIDALLVRLRY